MIRLEIVGDTLEDFNHKVRSILGELARDMGASVSRLEQVAESASTQAPAKTETSDNVVTMKTASEAIAEAEDAEKTKRNTAARKYGESDWDKKRRTKEQMAVDTEIEELTSALGIEIDKTVPADRLVVLLREQSASATDETDTNDKPNISASPEDRKEPETVEAEVVYTRDDVRDMLGKYAEKFGMAQAQKEGPGLMGAPKISEIPDNPEAFAKAVRNIKEALDG